MPELRVRSQRGGLFDDVLLVVALSLATCAWWYMFWSGRPSHFDVHDIMTARARLSPHQQEQNESLRVLFPWIYMGLASVVRSKFALTLAHFVAALVFFGGSLALYRHQRTHASRMEQVAAMSLLCFYSTSAYQAVNRWGELLAPGLLALSLGAAVEGAALAALLLLAFQRLDYGALSLLVFGLERIRRGISVVTVGRWLGRAAPIVAGGLLLALTIEFDPGAPNRLPFTREVMAQQAAVALNPNTWIWYGMYLLPAALFASALDGRWSVPLLAGIAANLALTFLFGAWAEFRLLLPTTIFLICARCSDREPAEP